jgi:ABC-type antimicrobial peptide transport system permease subunit
MVAAQGLRVTGLGIAIGVPASLLLARLLTSLLFGVQAHDPLTLAGGVLTLSAVAALALLKPARRATRVDPAITLRYE